MTSKTLNVPDISCGHCKMSIEGALKELNGVSQTEVHIDPRTVDVTWDDSLVNLEAIIETIEEQGYEVAR